MELKILVQIKNKEIDTIELILFGKMELVANADLHTNQSNLSLGDLEFFQTVSNITLCNFNKIILLMVLKIKTEFLSVSVKLGNLKNHSGMMKSFSKSSSSSSGMYPSFLCIFSLIQVGFW